MPKSPVRPTHPSDVALRKARLEAARQIELERRAVEQQQFGAAPTALIILEAAGGAAPSAGGAAGAAGVAQRVQRTKACMARPSSRPRRS